VSRFACDATDVDERFTIASCAACGVRRTLPVPASLAPYYATDLAATMHAPSHGLFARAQGVLLRREARRLLSCDDPVLDVGCGNGSFVRVLAGGGARVVAVDATVERPATLRDLPDVPYHAIDFDRGAITGLATGRYAVVLRHVLEHVRDPRAFLEALRAQGGRRFYLVVPNAGSVESRLLGPHWYLWDPPRHLWHFDDGSLRRLCDRVGLDVVAAGHDTVPALVPSVYRLLRRRGLPRAIYAPFGPQGALAALSTPLDLLLGGNVCWLIAEARR
jgi:SAM-dependent methyltransferase